MQNGFMLLKLCFYFSYMTVLNDSFPTLFRSYYGNLPMSFWTFGEDNSFVSATDNFGKPTIILSSRITFQFDL